MDGSPRARMLMKAVDPRQWAWWQLPPLLRGYVGIAVLAWPIAFALAAWRTNWRLDDLAVFAVLLVGILSAVASTPRSAYVAGGMTQDFSTAWLLPFAVLLPPVYALAAPLPLVVLVQRHINRGAWHRRTFSAAAIGLGYAGASLIFRMFPATIAGAAMGTGRHAVTWGVAVVCAELIGAQGHSILIQLAVKVSDPSIRTMRARLGTEALLTDLIELNLAVALTIMLRGTVVFVVFAVPLWALVRRYITHTELVAKSRVDAKTGLLNSSAWEVAATAEVERAKRASTPLALALIDIDHFKRVNDTFGHLAGDVALRAVTDAIRQHLRSYDLAGRFGGEEFVVLLPQAPGPAAERIAERLRLHIAGLVIPVSPRPAPSGSGHQPPSAAVPQPSEPDATAEPGKQITLTVSIGLSRLGPGTPDLPALMAAADSALYHAKYSGRNRTHIASEPITSPPPTPVFVRQSAPLPPP